MKHMLTILLVLAALEAPFAAGQTTPRTITVFGSASTTVIPDQVLWNLTVAVRDKDQARMRQEADAVLQEVFAAAGRLGEIISVSEFKPDPTRRDIEDAADMNGVDAGDRIHQERR